MNATVVIPTYNERENLPPLLQGILSYPGLRVMIIDDRSPDGTGEVADRLAHDWSGRVEVVHRTGRRGFGRSLLEGLARAVTRDEELVFQMDADFSHDPKYLPAMAAAAQQADLVIGSRYLNGVSVVNWPLRRIVLTTFANRYIRTVTRLSTRDCTSGYRCWRREALARLPLNRIGSEGYSLLVEMLYSPKVLLESAVTPWRIRLGG